MQYRSDEAREVIMVVHGTTEGVSTTNSIVATCGTVETPCVGAVATVGPGDASNIGGGGRDPSDELVSRVGWPNIE